jgi:hypothetical protein
MQVFTPRTAAKWACGLVMAGACLFVAFRWMMGAPPDTPSDSVPAVDGAMPADTPEAHRIMTEMKRPTGVEDPPEIHRAVRDGQFERLHSMDPIPAGVADFFVEIYRDARQDEAVRDYALQHMAPLYERLLAEDAAVADRATLRDELWRAAESGSGTFSGTALLALAHLADKTPEIEAERVRSTAARVAESGDTPSRIAALTLCTRLAVTGGLAGARDAAVDPSSIPLRLAAIAVLGRVGDDADAVLLRQMAAQEESAIVKSAALKALSRREGNSEPRGGT